jgi:major intracellular serine protease
MIRSSNIFESFPNSTGAGVRIGICDSWCDTSHPRLKDRVSEYKRFTNRESVQYDKHGTHIVGIISSLVPDASIFFAESSFISSGGYMELEKALKWMSELNLDVLNLSLSYGKDVLSIRSILEKLDSTSCIICSSYSEPMKYPHSYEFVVSSGGYSGGGGVNVFAPYEVMSFTPGGGTISMRGSSMSCACVSAAACLFKQGRKNAGRNEFLSALSMQHDGGETPTTFKPSYCNF